MASGSAAPAILLDSSCAHGMGTQQKRGQPCCSSHITSLHPSRGLGEHRADCPALPSQRDGLLQPHHPSPALRASVRLITNALKRGLVPRGRAAKANTGKPHFCHRDTNSPISAKKAWPLREEQIQLRRAWQFCVGAHKGMMSGLRRAAKQHTEDGPSRGRSTTQTNLNHRQT